MSEEEFVSWLFANPDTAAAVALVIAVSVLVIWLVLRWLRPRWLCRKVPESMRPYALTLCKNFSMAFSKHCVVEKQGDKQVKRYPRLHCIDTATNANQILAVIDWPNNRYRQDLAVEGLDAVRADLDLPENATLQIVNNDKTKSRGFRFGLQVTLPVDASVVTLAQVEKDWQK